jgi:anti-anti-sigma regulatory factor
MSKKNTATTVSEASSADRGDSVCHLEPNLEIQSIEETRRDLLEALARALPMTVDVSRVVSIDTAGVQLLLALRSTAAKNGVGVEFCGESVALTNALAMLGLQGALSAAPRHEG